MNMPEIGVPELLIVAFIVILLFGPSKAADLGGSLGKSIREFRKASQEDGEAAPTVLSQGSPSASDGVSDANDAISATAASSRFCTECGTRLEDGQRFCTNCGAPAVAGTI